jgi:hypothetical protein
LAAPITATEAAMAKVYSDKSNARRAARKALLAAGCTMPDPSDYTITEAEGGFSFALAPAWAPQHAAAEQTDPVLAEVAAGTEILDAPEDDDTALGALIATGAGETVGQACAAAIAAIGELDVAAIVQGAGTAATEPPAKAKAKGKDARSIEDARAAALAGGPLPTLKITSAANASYQKRAGALRDLAEAGDIEALRQHAVTGSNTYARMLRRYQEALVAYLDARKEVA